MTHALLLGLLVTLAVALGYRGSAIEANAQRDTAVLERKAAYAELEGVKTTLATERRKAASMAAIGTQHEKDKAHEQVAADSLLADLRTDNRRLRAHWQAALATTELSRTAASAGFADGGTDLRQRDVAAVRGIVGRCEAHVRGLQAVNRQDRIP